MPLFSSKKTPPGQDKKNPPVSPGSAATASTAGTITTGEVTLASLSLKLDDLLHWITETHLAVKHLQRVITGEYTAIMTDLSRLQTDVANNTSVTQSAVTLIQGLADAIRAAGTDQAALDSLANDLEASSSALAAAVSANTPASGGGSTGGGDTTTG